MDAAKLIFHILVAEREMWKSEADDSVGARMAVI
jgi:hypothetical protein